jgi:hypothetical protein
MLGYCVNGLAKDDFYLPGRWGPRTDQHLHGIPAWLLCVAIACNCFVMLSVVVGHYDHRTDVVTYMRFRAIVSAVGWIFFAASIAVMMYGGWLRAGV